MLLVALWCFMMFSDAWCRFIWLYFWYGSFHPWPADRFSFTCCSASCSMIRDPRMASQKNAWQFSQHLTTSHNLSKSPSAVQAGHNPQRSEKKQNKLQRHVGHIPARLFRRSSGLSQILAEETILCLFHDENDNSILIYICVCVFNRQK